MRIHVIHTCTWNDNIFGTAKIENVLCSRGPELIINCKMLQMKMEQEEPALAF